MSAAINDGGPAFPCEQGHTPDGAWNQSFDPGMSLRDYFAAKAMQAIVVSGRVNLNVAVSKSDEVSQNAYRLADAMLAARSVA